MNTHDKQTIPTTLDRIAELERRLDKMENHINSIEVRMETFIERLEARVNRLDLLSRENLARLRSSVHRDMEELKRELT